MMNTIGCCIETAHSIKHSFAGAEDADNKKAEARMLGQRFHELVSLTELQTQAKRRLESSMASVNLWRRQHEDHNDAASHRCYTRALFGAASVYFFCVDTLGMVELQSALTELNETLHRVDTEFYKGK